MKKIKILASLALVVIVLSGCNGTGSQGRGLTSSTGRAGEVLIVCPESLWKGDLGDSLQEILMQPVSILPQYEPLFLLSHATPQRFKAAYQKQRNIVILLIDSTLEKGRTSVAYDQWAAPQLVIKIAANNMHDLIAEFSLYQNELIKRLLAREMSRFLKAQKSRQDFRLSRELEKRYNISMVTPTGFIFAVKNPDFCWLRRDSKNWIQNILIYSQKYVSAEQFSEKYIIQLRDSLTKQYVFGSADSSYVTTDKEHYPPIVEQAAIINSDYAMRTVGLWETEGDHMGGPFVSFTILDKKRNRVITIESFLYAPNDRKRDLLRQIEAIILNMNILDLE